MFVHSVPEGIAIGAGYATGETKFGLLLATAIAVHNIPEGTAVSVPLRERGASIGRCAGLPTPCRAVAGICGRRDDLPRDVGTPAG